MTDPPGPLESLVSATHFLTPDALPALIVDRGRQLGAEATTLYIVDLDQHWLVPLGTKPGEALELAAVDGTLAGRSYRSVAVLDSAAPGELVVWVPVLDGTERLGVLRFLFLDRTSADEKELEAFASLVAQLVVTKSVYGDYFACARRRKPLTIAAELLWQLLPPLTFATPELVISAVFAPTEDVGGDAFDFGADASCLRAAIFDAMGHGLGAGLMATTTVAAYRNSRRTHLEHRETAERISDTIAEHFGDGKFVTGVLASLDSTSGQFSWCVAGHPPPLLIRRGRVVRELDHGRGLPFGLGPASAVFQEQLEPGDRVLLYTDGMVEARDAHGELFGLERLVDTITQVAGEDPPPEALRRLMHAVQEHCAGPMNDDATVVTIEWQGSGRSTLEM